MNLNLIAKCVKAKYENNCWFEKWNVINFLFFGWNSCIKTGKNYWEREKYNREWKKKKEKLHKQFDGLFCHRKKAQEHLVLVHWLYNMHPTWWSSIFIVHSMFSMVDRPSSDCALLSLRYFARSHHIIGMDGWKNMLWT